MTTEKLVCERLCIDFCNKYEEQKSTIRELEARIAALTKDAELMPLLKDARKELHACQAVIHLALSLIHI